MLNEGMKKKIGTAVVTVLCAVVLLTGCGGKKAETAESEEVADDADAAADSSGI